MIIDNVSLSCIWASSGSNWGLELAGKTRMLDPCSAGSTAVACPAPAADGQLTDIPITASYKGAAATKYFLSLFLVSRILYKSLCCFPAGIWWRLQDSWGDHREVATGLLRDQGFAVALLTTFWPQGGHSSPFWGWLVPQHLRTPACPWGIGGARWFYM